MSNNVHEKYVFVIDAATGQIHAFDKNDGSEVSVSPAEGDLIHSFYAASEEDLLLFALELITKEPSNESPHTQSITAKRVEDYGNPMSGSEKLLDDIVGVLIPGGLATVGAIIEIAEVVIKEITNPGVIIVADSDDGPKELKNKSGSLPGDNGPVDPDEVTIKKNEDGTIANKEWLDKNCPGWEENSGMKMAEEKNKAMGEDAPAVAIIEEAQGDANGDGEPKKLVPHVGTLPAGDDVALDTGSHGLPQPVSAAAGNAKYAQARKSDAAGPDGPVEGQTNSAQALSGFEPEVEIDRIDAPVSTGILGDAHSDDVVAGGTEVVAAVDEKISAPQDNVPKQGRESVARAVSEEVSKKGDGSDGVVAGESVPHGGRDNPRFANGEASRLAREEARLTDVNPADIAFAGGAGAAMASLQETRTFSPSQNKDKARDIGYDVGPAKRDSESGDEGRGRENNQEYAEADEGLEFEEA